MTVSSGETAYVHSFEDRTVRVGYSDKAVTVSVSSLRRKTVAVGSGKGGVGKSTTAVNLAIVAAKSGRRVALVDLDPLSNIATILDVPASRVEKVAERVAEATGSLSAYTVPLFPRIDLLFPRPNTSQDESARLRAALFERCVGELNELYDIVLCDMPAGIGHEENLGFLPFVGTLLIVTNSEPTSHVSAGGYIRVALEIQPDLRILLWHNRFRGVVPGGFRPTEVVANYNRYVDEEMRIPDTASEQIAHLARVPDDPSLNLLQQSLSAEIQVLGKLLDTARMLKRVVIAGLEPGSSLDRGVADEFRYFLNAYSGELTEEALMEESATYALLDEPADAGELIGGFLGHPLTPAIHECSADLEAAIESLVNRNRLFWKSTDDGRLIRRARASVLRLIGTINRESGGLFKINLGGMLVCYLALLMILESGRVRSLITEAIPSRRVDGRRLRDRRLLIRNLVVRNADYHKRYFELVKTLFPVLIRQVDRLVERNRWKKLLLRSPDREVNKNAYLKLLTHALHDVLHAGLGVYVGFRYNTAGRAIEEGAKRLMRITAPGHTSDQ